ncbi:hypothetical protein SpCBS45565_g00419 [Spizellomyces sp. 'palustris']|nr:hypothetical protein SpCBS45565_g00419 [Spizellomyces sp. 'palustris']
MSKKPAPTSASPANTSNFLDVPDIPPSHIPPSFFIDCKPSAERPRTFKPPVPSALLSKVAAFLPQIDAANSQLLQTIQQDSEKQKQVDIENVDDDGQYIQMDLGVGVFDTQPQTSVPNEKDIIITGRPTVDEDEKPLIEVIQRNEQSKSESESAGSDDDDNSQDDSNEDSELENTRG